MYIAILNRTTKSEGAITLRFRLRDGRAVDLTHRSGIRADIVELEKLDADGTPRKGVRVYNKQLAAEIATEVRAMRTAYALMCEDDAPRNNVVFARYLERVKTGQTATAGDIETRYAEYVREGARDGIRGESGTRTAKYAGKILHRFLRVECLEGIKPSAFDADKLLRLRAFAIDEYKYVTTHPKIYADEKPQQTPKKQRGRNTTALLMHIYGAFFAELENAGEIERTPFARIGKEKRKKINREQYNTPVFLTAAELQTIRTASVPDDLEETRTAFVLQCALGCRISDYKHLTMRNVSKHPDGFLYVHYLPQKTHESASDFAEVETPLIRYAAEIVAARGGFSFGILRDSYEYNKAIRRLFAAIGLQKECPVYNEQTGQNEYKPIHEIASNKIARKTAVDILVKAQINLYASGLHTDGSAAVHHYTDISTADRYTLMCYAYGEKPYKVTDDMRIE